MICYRDMTFCPYHETCTKGHDCARALTVEVVQASAISLMPVAKFAEKPDCFEQMEEV